jgi:uncharacterized protein
MMLQDGKTAPLHSSAVVITEMASRYLQQLCKHFGHKLPVNFTPHRGAIVFDFGMCSLAVKDNMLNLTVTADDEVSLSRLKHVIGSHLERFAFRDKPEIAWN